jgi:hypothetical protein
MVSRLFSLPNDCLGKPRRPRRTALILEFLLVCRIAQPEAAEPDTRIRLPFNPFPLFFFSDPNFSNA